MGWARQNVPGYSAVSSALSSIDDAIIQPVVHTVEDVVSDPNKLITLATAIVAPELLPLVSGGLQLAQGNSLEDAAKSAALSYAAQGLGQAAGSLGDQAGAAAQYGTDLGSQQTAMLAAQEAGLGTLGDVAGNIAGGTAAGIVRGQDPLSALVSSGISSGTSAVTSQIPGFADLSPSAQKAVNVAVSAELQGKDPTQGLINAAINAGIAETRNQTQNIGALPSASGNTNAGTSGSPDISAGPDISDEPVGALPTFDTTFAPDYSLSSNTHAAPTLDEMGGAQGLQVPADTSSAESDPGNAPVDYGLNPSVPFDGLQMPTTPNDPSMGGGQGLTIPVDGGTMTGSGLIDSSYTPDLGDPNSFINGGTGGLSGATSTVKTPVTTTQPATTQTTATSKTNPFGVLPLDSSPQMLTSTAPTGQSTAKAGQLRQLFDSLTPEMKSVFADKGLAPSENGMTNAATGGLISTETAKILSDMNPKFSSAPTHLQSVSPQQSTSSRLAALSHLAQGPLKGRGLSNHLSEGGLPQRYVEASPQGHKPEFITGLTGYYAQGGGTGQSDDIPAMLHDGDFVMDADTVASLGDGSSKAGAEVLEKMRKQVHHHDKASGNPVPAQIADGEYVFPAAFVTAIGGGSNKVGAERLNEMREKIRAHKRSAPTTKIPPKAKSPLDYLKMAKG